jgi:hypothetical protein
MYQIHLKFNHLTKKITISRTLSYEDLANLISHSFSIKDRVVGVTDSKGKFYDLHQVTDNLSAFQK